MHYIEIYYKAITIKKLVLSFLLFSFKKGLKAGISPILLL